MRPEQARFGTMAPWSLAVFGLSIIAIQLTSVDPHLPSDRRAPLVVTRKTTDKENS
jgi:hypothetical protein